MRASHILTVASVLFFSASSTSGIDTRVIVRLKGDTPPISDHLWAYRLAVFRGPAVGFNGASLGEGTGDGWDELVPFSFRFSRFSSISSAKLILKLMPGHEGIITDGLSSADTLTGNRPFLYGNDQLRDLPVGVESKVVFDLKRIERMGQTEDLSGYLLDGDLDVVYVDDAIVRWARLVVKGTPELAENRW